MNVIVIHGGSLSKLASWSLTFICLQCLVNSGHAQNLDSQTGQTLQPLTHTHHTRLGSITGRIENVELWNGQGVPDTGRDIFYSFRGIPYASQPTRSKRFDEPEPMFNWMGDLKATRPTPSCPRPGLLQDYNEDCLYLNVFTKNLILSSRNNFEQGSSSRSQQVQQPLRPVIVFLPGFETEGGASSLGAEKMMREDLVVVTVEYRVGILGFLSDGYSTLPGNWGVQDVVQALTWVQQSISEFGGDSRQVTVVGHGQGAVIAHLLSLQPATSGLFQQVGLMSQTALCPASISYYGEKIDQLAYSSNNKVEEIRLDPALSPYKIYNRVLTLTNCHNIQCLRDKSIQELLRAQSELEKDELTTMSVFVPVVDETLRTSPVVSSPDKMTGRPMPMLIGNTRQEGEAMARDLLGTGQSTLLESEYTIKNKLLPKILSRVVSEKAGKLKHLVEYVYRQYFGEIQEASYYEKRSAVSSLLGDLLVNSCIRQTILSHRKRSAGSIYAYLFSYKSDDHLDQAMGYNNRRVSGYRNSGGPGLYGGREDHSEVTRGDDLQYMWNIGINQVSQHQPSETVAWFDDRLVSKNITNIWATFARIGTPVPAHAPQPSNNRDITNNNLQILNPSQVWHRVEMNGPISYYNISLESAGTVYDFRMAESQFWLYQMRFTWELSYLIYTLQGYKISTWVLVCLFLITLGAVVMTVWMRNNRRRKVHEDGGGYSGWLANMSAISDGGQQDMQQRK